MAAHESIETRVTEVGGAGGPELTRPLNGIVNAAQKGSLGPAPDATPSCRIRTFVL